MNPNAKAALNQYRAMDVHSGIAEASPHRLIQMLMDGVLEKLHTAKGCMERGEFVEKGRQVGWAISLIGGLNGSLDLERGGDIARNLADLYDYMKRRLLAANSENSPAIVDEVAALMRELKAGWDAIPSVSHQGVLASRQVELR